MVYLGIDWAEAHHDLCLLSETGTVLGRGRVSDGVEGVARLHEMVAEHASDPGEDETGRDSPRRCHRQWQFDADACHQVGPKYLWHSSWVGDRLCGAVR